MSNLGEIIIISYIFKFGITIIAFQLVVQWQIQMGKGGEFTLLKLEKIWKNDIFYQIFGPVSKEKKERKNGQQFFKCSNFHSKNGNLGAPLFWIYKYIYIFIKTSAIQFIQWIHFCLSFYEYSIEIIFEIFWLSWKISKYLIFHRI